MSLVVDKYKKCATTILLDSKFLSQIKMTCSLNPQRYALIWCMFRIKQFHRREHIMLLVWLINTWSFQEERPLVQIYKMFGRWTSSFVFGLNCSLTIRTLSMQNAFTRLPQLVKTVWLHLVVVTVNMCTWTTSTFSIWMTLSLQMDKTRS